MKHSSLSLYIGEVARYCLEEFLHCLVQVLSWSVACSEMERKVGSIALKILEKENLIMCSKVL